MMTKQLNSGAADDGTEQAPAPRTHRPAETESKPERPKEIGGRKGPEPTRYGDWEKNGRCIDF